MQLPPVDLSNCDKEPIHIPGSIQSHGFLLAVDRQSLTITYLSENISSFIPVQAADLLDATLPWFEQLAGMNPAEGQLQQILQLGETKKSFEAVNPYPVAILGKPFYLGISVSGPVYLMEFEPVSTQYDIQNQIGKSVSEILSGKNLKTILQYTAAEIRELIRYDRVMIYKFLEDGHGEVVAEEKEAALEPFFGLHYPATDIPAQARELYKLNLTRIIADVATENPRIITRQEDTPLDLTHSSLRAVSPIHIQYLKNMGVHSSFSISLMAHGELWGLVACHNYSPKFIDYKTREAAKLIGKIVSSALEYREEEEQEEQHSVYSHALEEIARQLGKDEAVTDALTRRKYTLKDISSATGVAIRYEGEIATAGETPDEAELKELFVWLARTMEDSIYYTHSLPEIYQPARRFKTIGSGIIACMLSRELEEIIVWFKPEQITTIHWAGNPDKPAMQYTGTDGLLQLSPRNSFEKFSTEVRHTAVKWTKTEINNVLRIREKVVSAISKKAGEIRLLNERLKRAYDELDTFSYTISHDLRTPLTSIKSYTELVMMSNKSIDEQGRKLLGRVVAGADRMNYLISEILKLARVGRGPLEISLIPMEQLIRDSTTEIVAALHAEQTVITFGSLPDIEGSPVLISQVFSNLISNAIKYSSVQAAPKVSISAELREDEIIYRIQDNGIGIAAEHQEKVYELFKRMSNVRDIEGTGVGLAIVKRIVEKHNARIWFESELEVGTIFYIAFKNTRS